MVGTEAKRSILKIGVGIVAALFLGALGSGLWERLLGPLADWGLRKLLAGSGQLSTAYLNYLYSDVGRGLDEQLSLLPFIALTVFAVISNLGLILLLIAYGRITSNSVAFLQAVPAPGRFLRSRRFRWMFIALGIINIVLYSDLLFVTAYHYKTVVWLERSIEIVRPRIMESRYLELRAMYRSVNDAKGFFILWRDLNTISVQQHVKLPEFKPLGARG